MYSMFPYPTGYEYPGRQQEQNPVFSVYGIIPVYLGGKPGTERVVLYTSSNTGLKAKAEIQILDEGRNKWTIEYSAEAVGVPYFMVTSGYWEIVGRNVVVLYYNEGSGNYLTYKVLGKRQDAVQELVERNGIFMGSVWFDGPRLIESEGLRHKVWTSRRRQLILVPYRVLLIPGASVIEFSISNDGTIHIPKTKYIIPPDSIVQIIRKDLNQIMERALFNYTPNIQYIKHRNAFRIWGEGILKFTIIPGGYDWDKSVEVTVTATRNI